MIMTVLIKLITTHISSQNVKKNQILVLLWNIGIFNLISNGFKKVKKKTILPISGLFSINLLWLSNCFPTCTSNIIKLDKLESVSHVKVRHLDESRFFSGFMEDSIIHVLFISDRLPLSQTRRYLASMITKVCSGVVGSIIHRLITATGQLHDTGFGDGVTQKAKK